MKIKIHVSYLVLIKLSSYHESDEFIIQCNDYQNTNTIRTIRT